MNCTECNCEIPRGEEYVTDLRNVERVERRFFRTDITTVKDSKVKATWHLECAPAELI